MNLNHGAIDDGGNCRKVIKSLSSELDRVAEENGFEKSGSSVEVPENRGRLFEDGKTHLFQHLGTFFEKDDQEDELVFVGKHKAVPSS